MSPTTMMEVPQQVRAFAGSSVDQAEKAFAAFLDAAAKSVALIPPPASEVPKQMLSMTEQNIKASFDHARKLLQAADLQEFAQIQSDFLKTQLATAAEQMKTFGAKITESAKHLPA